MEKPILVVMAAGMGSRYGGLKQIDPVGSHNEAILDYSIYDAHEAGFDTVVIIIKKAIKDEFMEMVGSRLEKAPVEIRYAYQEVDAIPEGYTVPEGREKPWGTSHAVLCAAEAIGNAPFAVINADDYYGKAAFKVVYDYLSTHTDGEKYNYCMVGYEVGNTVTEHGSVARGVCETDDQDHLLKVTERTRIEKYEGGIHYTEDNGETWVELPEHTKVSMNLWGFTPGFLKEIRNRLPAFLDQVIKAKNPKAEFFLPTTVSELLAENKATVTVLHSPDKWYGVTYAADKAVVVEAMKSFTEQGLYPAEGLWHKYNK